MKSYRFTFLLVFLVFSVSPRAHGQSTTTDQSGSQQSALVDSLEAQLTRLRDDSLRFETYLLLAEAMATVRADACLKYVQPALDLAKRLEYDLIIPYLRNLQGMSYDDLGQYDRAIDAYQRAIELTYHTMNTLSEEARKEYYWDLVIYYNNLGYSFFNTGRYEEAMQYYLRALDVGEQSKCPDLSLVYGSIAELYYSIGDIGQARRYISQARTIARDSSALLFDASLLGDIYLAEQKYDSAAIFFRTILSAGGDTLSNYEKVIAFKGLARMYYATGDAKAGLDAARHCYDVAVTLENKAYQAAALALIAQGQFLTSRSEEGAENLRRAIAIAESTNSLVELEEYFHMLSLYYRDLGDYRNAYTYEKQSREIRDTLRGTEMSNYMTRLALDEQIEKHAEESSALKVQLARDRQLIRKSAFFSLAMLLFGLTILAVVLLMLRYRRGQAFHEIAANLQQDYSDKHIFLKRVTFGVALMLLPIILHAFIWDELKSLLFLGIAFLFVALMWTLAKFEKVMVAAFLIMAVAYPSMATVPLYTGSLSAAYLAIAATFFVVTYLVKDYRLQLLNGVLAIASVVLFTLLMPHSIDFTISDPQGHQLMIGVMSLGAIIITLYYYQGHITDFKRSLDQANRFLRQIADTNPHFIFAKDINRKFTFANQSLVDAYGVTRSEIIGRRDEDIHPAFASDAHFRLDDEEVLQTGKTKHISEERIVLPDGKEMWLDTIKKPMSDHNGITGLLGVAIDVTEHRRTNQKLKESHASLQRSERRYRMMLEDNLFPIFSVYRDRFKSVNHATCVLTGYDAEELKELPVSRLVHPDDLEEYEKFARNVVTGHKRTGSLNSRFLRKDGSTGHILASIKAHYDTDGTYLESIVTAADISQLKKAEQELAESEQRYRVLFDQYPIGIAVLAAREGNTIENWNSKFLEIFSVDASEARGTTLLDYSPGRQPDGEPSEDKFRQILEDADDAGDTTRFEWQFKRARGDLFLAQVLCAPVKVGGEFLVIAMIQDITQLKKAEEELKASENRYRSLVEASADGIIMTDTRGNITFASRRILSMGGMKEADKLTGRNILSFTVAGERERATRDFGKVLTSTESVFGRYHIRLGMQDQLPVEIGARTITGPQGEALGVVFHIRDITAQLQSERTLKESETRYRLLFETAFDGLIIVNANGEVEDGNQSAVQLLRYPDIDALCLQTLDDLFPGISYKQAYRAIVRGETIKTPSIRINGKDYFDIDIFAEVHFCTLPVGGEQRIACAIRDVAEKIMLEKQEREIADQKIEMDALNREITSNTLLSSQRNRLLSEIRDEIREVVQNGNTHHTRTALSRIMRKIDSNLNENEDMLAFKIQFEKIHPNFFQRLLNHNPKLTNTDLKYCAYIRLNMTTPDICNLLYIEKKSVEMAKYRIKKKLGLGKRQRLGEFIRAI